MQPKITRRQFCIFIPVAVLAAASEACPDSGEIGPEPQAPDGSTLLACEKGYHMSVASQRVPTCRKD